MKRYRQWLAEREDHMTESSDGEYYLVLEVDAALAEKEVEITVQKLQIIAMSTEITEKEEQIAALQQEQEECIAEIDTIQELAIEEIAALQKRERVLIDRLQSHGDVETDKEEALRGGEE